MKQKKSYRILAVLALVFVFASAKAQQVSPVDFMRLSPYQTNANPATDLPYRFVVSAAVGNISLNVQNTTLHYDNLFEFDAQGRPATINLRQFSNSLKEKNFIGLNANVDVLTLYKRHKKGMVTINYGVKVQSDTKYSDGLFKLLGYGNGAFIGEDNPVKMDMDFNVMAYQELAVGYQHKVNEKLSVGGKAKLLFGAANVTTEAFGARLYTDADTYALRLEENVAMKAALPNAVYVDEAGKLMGDGPFSVGELFRNPGFGIDLAAEYSFDDQHSVVAAIHDLGFIHWGKNNISMTSQLSDVGQFYDNGNFLFSGLDWEQIQWISTDEWYREQFLDTLKQYFQLEFAPLRKYNTALNTNLLLRGNYDFDAHHRFSMQVQGCFLGSGFRPAFTVAYCGSFYDIFNVCATYTAMPLSYDNIGIGVSAMIKACNIYLTTNNLIGLFKPMNASAFSAQLGIVFNLFVPERHYVDESGMPEYLE